MNTQLSEPQSKDFAAADTRAELVARIPEAPVAPANQPVTREAKGAEPDSAKASRVVVPSILEPAMLNATEVPARRKFHFTWLLFRIYNWLSLHWLVRGPRRRQKFDWEW